MKDNDESSYQYTHVKRNEALIVLVTLIIWGYLTFGLTSTGLTYNNSVLPYCIRFFIKSNVYSHIWADTKSLTKTKIIACKGNLPSLFHRVYSFLHLQSSVKVQLGTQHDDQPYEIIHSLFIVTAISINTVTHHRHATSVKRCLYHITIVKDVKRKFQAETLHPYFGHPCKISAWNSH